MKRLLILCCCIALFAQRSHGQMSVNADWRERNGLTVASSQVVTVRAAKMRFFTTIASAAADPRTALTEVNGHKTAITDALSAIGYSQIAVNSTPTKIREWQQLNNQTYWRSDWEPLTVKTDLDEYTAIAHVFFDISLDGVSEDEVDLKMYDICKQLRSHPGLGSQKILVWRFLT